MSGSSSSEKSATMETTFGSSPRSTVAAVLMKQNMPLHFFDIEIPPLKRGQVLVDIYFTSVCHTQLNEIKGTKGPDRFLPHTMGHEASGKVLEVGEGVTKVKIGDHVVCSWIKGQGIDVPSCQYKDTFGGLVINSGAITTFMQQSVISENRLIAIPKEMPLKEACLLGCAVPTGMGSVLREMKIKEGQSVAIFGAGGVGQSALIGCKLKKANPIIAVDVDDEKLARAQEFFGATHVINALKEDPVDKIKEITEGTGVDYSLESCGQVKVMEQAFQALKFFGGLCVIAGNAKKGEKIQIDPYDLIMGKNVIGTWGGASKIDEDVAYYVDLYLKGEIPEISHLITHEMILAKIDYLFRELEIGKVGRAMIPMKGGVL